MYKYLGIDCANKSLAYSSVTITSMAEIIKCMRHELVNFANENFADPWSAISPLAKNSPCFAAIFAEQAVGKPEQLLKLLKRLNEIAASRFRLEVGGVIDLIPGRKVKDVHVVERTRLLRNALDTMPTGADKTTVIEEQPPVLNFKSSTVRDQIMMHYCLGKVVMINPTLKNKLYFHDSLKHEHFVAKYAKRYDANKAHTEANLRYFVKTFGCEHALHGVKNANYPDFADSFMETLAYHFSNVDE